MGVGIRASTATLSKSNVTFHVAHFPFGLVSVFARRMYASTRTVSFSLIMVALILSFCIRAQGSRCSVALYASLNATRESLR